VITELCPSLLRIVSLHEAIYNPHRKDYCYELFKRSLRRLNLAAEEYEWCVVEYCRRVGL